MAGRFVNPYPQMLDSTPEVYSGGKLNFYASGTSTPLDTYTTKALAVANPNPIVLNSAGRPAVDIFLQDLEYKVVLTDSSDNVIWTADPVSHRDSGLVAKTITGSGSPNGSVAGTAGSSSILPDFYWDYTNSILYVCTTTGTSSTAVWTAVNASAATPSVPTPQGRLSLTSGTPIISSDVVAGTAVYYMPYVGNLVPIYNGATMVPTEFAELTLSLVASHALNTIYDVFVFSNSGVVTIATGPAWSVSTAGSGARGTGASTTELTRVKGLWVNAVAMTGRNGSTTYSIGANLATYVGTIIIDGTAGQITQHTAFGQSRLPGPWNAYNRRRKILKAGDSTSSWTYALATVRASRGQSANSIKSLVGLSEDIIKASFTQVTSIGVNASTGRTAVYIGLDSTTAGSGLVGVSFVDRSDGAGLTVYETITAKHSAVSLGANVWTALEGAATSGTNTFFGGETQMLLELDLDS